MAKQITQIAPQARVSNFTSGFGRRSMRTYTVTSHGASIVLKDDREHKQMSIVPSKEALVYLLSFCQVALRDWRE